MSRINFRTKHGNPAAFGLDHTQMGWFYQEFDAGGECTLDLDQLFTPHFGRAQLLEMVHARVDNKELARLEPYLQRAALGLDPVDPDSWDHARDQWANEDAPDL